MEEIIAGIIGHAFYDAITETAKKIFKKDPNIYAIEQTINEFRKENFDDSEVLEEIYINRDKIFEGIDIINSVNIQRILIGNGVSPKTALRLSEIIPKKFNEIIKELAGKNPEIFRHYLIRELKDINCEILKGLTELKKENIDLRIIIEPIIEYFRGKEIETTDDYESPTPKFSTNNIGAGTVNRSIETSYKGDFSIKSITGINAGDINRINYFHTNFHEKKVGVQIRFASQSTLYDIHIILLFDDGNNSYQGEAFFTFQDKTLTVAGSVTAIAVHNDIHIWNIMKFIVDLETKKFVSASVNTFNVYLNNDMKKSPSSGIKCIKSTIAIAGSGATVYLDDYKFYEVLA